ncbi:MAG: hypothetical protein M4579_001916 [Chaenotheca gracillima]|nr:MAG: hypothetical protein M4579_001916 [Chaenotheca gracillima]
MASHVKTLVHSLSQTLNVQPRLSRQSRDWKYALLDIKILYLEQEYKKCRTRCEELLAESADSLHPLHTIYLHFYSAICLESTADSVHPLSTKKLPLLERSRQEYLHAGSILCELEPLADEEDGPPSPSSFAESFSSASESVEAITPSTTPDISMISGDEETELEDYKDFPMTPTPRSPSAHLLLPSPLGAAKFKPSPLRVRKIVRFSPSTFSLDRPDEINLRSNYLAPESPTPGEYTIPSSPPTLESQSPVKPTGGYVFTVCSLSTQVATHLSELDTLIARTAEDQASRRITRFADLRHARFDEDLRALDRRSRIERMREQGWVKKRFDPRKYQMLARTALAELPGNSDNRPKEEKMRTGVEGIF